MMTSQRSELDKPRRTLVLGSGALQIGQAGEFDYSGTQAIKALKEEGVETVLVNPNIATIQTSEHYADAVYLLPVTPEFVEKVIVRENVDTILLAFGGQTALNCGVALEESGILEKYGVRVLGTPVSVISNTEDRRKFVDCLDEIDVKSARSEATSSVDDALAAAERIGYPVILRGAFSLGGRGSAIVGDREACERAARDALAVVPQILVEECLYGWKEVEYEVVRDAVDNCITVCNMENVDPMGIHTGESIVVAPSQTLNDNEYQLLRDVAIKTIRHLGVVGECNIQFALDPDAADYRVIEVNARLSRSSALASKATGYPLAYVAAKIALGYTLPEIPNAVTRTTTSFFEPAMDYIVCKVPRWDLDKFEGVETAIGTEMKSVGEVMAIGRSFPEAMQKALRMLEIGAEGLDPAELPTEELDDALTVPSPTRVFAIMQALTEGYTVDAIAELTRMDKFFLRQMERVARARTDIAIAGRNIDVDTLHAAKLLGFSDNTIAALTESTPTDVRAQRRAAGVVPGLAQIDTLAGEYPADTNYLYMSHAARGSDATPSERDRILVLGSGAYRIGSSVEFDWCAVNAVTMARELGYETILLNCNPETVSTDYDICDRLIFDEISVETVLDIWEMEKPSGVIVSMGGQTPNRLVMDLAKAGVTILGTPAESIDRAEDRRKFSALLDEIGVEQPRWTEATDIADLPTVVSELGGYPVLVRPSYVLSGAAMRVAHNGAELREFVDLAAVVSQDHPVVISKFVQYAREVEFDAVAKDGQIVRWAISEHIEDAGVHSGDATLVMPPNRLYLGTINKTRRIAAKIARALNVTGPFNIQLLARKDEVKVIECNLRASRSFPFVSKVLGANFIRDATSAILGRDVPRGQRNPLELDYAAVKVPQFSFSRLRGVDPRLGVEMASTGEVACFGADTDEALMKAMLASGFRLPRPGSGILLSVGHTGARDKVQKMASALRRMGHRLYATPETAEVLRRGYIGCEVVYDTSHDIRLQRVRDLLESNDVDLVISIPPERDDQASGFHVRRGAVDLDVPLISELWLARRLVRAMTRHTSETLLPLPWHEYLATEPI